MRSFGPAGMLMLLLPAVARAHVGGGDTGLFSGLMHPVFGLDHLLAMVSVGVVSSQLGGKNIWRIPAAFVSAMTVGSALGILRLTLPFAEVGITASVVVLGTAIVLAHRQMSPWPITGLVSFFGVLHGHAHGIEIPRAVSPALYTLGLLISTSVLHIFGVLIGEMASLQTWLWKGLRLAGGVVTLSGVAFLLQALGAALVAQ
jgi:urease accessory protein